MLKLVPFCALGMYGVSFGFYLQKITEKEIAKWICAGSLIFYVFNFATGFGTPPYIVNSEIYPVHLRGTGNSLAIFGNWSSNFLFSIKFLTFTHTYIGKIITYFVLGTFSVIAVIFIYYFLPETKGKTLEEVLGLFNDEKFGRLSQQKEQSKDDSLTDE